MIIFCAIFHVCWILFVILTLRHLAHLQKAVDRHLLPFFDYTASPSCFSPSPIADFWILFLLKRCHLFMEKKRICGAENRFLSLYARLLSTQESIDSPSEERGLSYRRRSMRGREAAAENEGRRCWSKVFWAETERRRWSVCWNVKKTANESEKQEALRTEIFICEVRFSDIWQHALNKNRRHV